MRDLEKRGIGFKVLAGQGAEIDISTPGGRRISGIFAALAEFERDLIHERVMAGLSAARARGRGGGAPCKMTAAKVRGLCREIGVASQTPYRHVAPDGQLRPDGLKLLGRARP